MRSNSAGNQEEATLPPSTPSPQHLRIRPATARDLGRILELERHRDNRDFVNQWSDEQHAAALVHPDVGYRVFHLEGDAEIVGYVILRGLTPPVEAVELMRLVLQLKGRGLGHRALELLEPLAFETLGAQRLWLDVFASNARARHLYRRRGFLEERVIPDGHQGTEGPEDLIIMAKRRGGGGGANS